MIVILLLVCHFMRPTETCSQDFCQDFTRTVAKQSVDSIDLGEDKISGCTCKEIPDFKSFCFGRANCLSFPRSFNFTTKTFILKNSRISRIQNGDLDNLKNVETLAIEGNFNLTEIQSGSLSVLKDLKNLSISYNANLRVLDEGSLDGLLSLQNLFLVKNGFISLGNVMPALKNLGNLKKLDLSENFFQIIKEEDFKVLESGGLEELNLILCQIDVIASKAFNPLKNLKALRLGENNFNSTILARVIEESSNKTFFKLLNLYGIGLKKSASKPLLEAISKTNISSLNLSRNQFELITSETFPKMPNLQVLDLRECLVSKITNDAFIGLQNLRRLFLSNNKLLSFPEDVHLESLTFLDLQQNSVSRSYFSLFGQKFKNMKNLEELNLSFNVLHVLYNQSFFGLTNLKILGLKNATIYRIESNTFGNLPNLIFLNLENNFFVKSNSEIINNGLFWKLKNLRVLLLGGCSVNYISKTAFKNLDKLQHLGLENNNLASAPDFQLLPNLQTIDLSENKLSTWEKPVFTKNHQLREIKASNNKFQTISEAMIEDFQKLHHLDFNENSLICNCFISFNLFKIINLLKNQTVRCNSGDLTLQEFLKLNHQCQNLPLIISLIVLTLILLISMFLVYYFRWHLRYWLFLTRLHLSRNQKIKSTSRSYSNYCYDAFVSYSSEDRNFVIRLVTMLENYPPFIKLCVYERDFEVGTIISENILDSVSKSRKTLLIISNSYAKS